MKMWLARRFRYTRDLEWWLNEVDTQLERRDAAIVGLRSLLPGYKEGMDSLAVIEALRGAVKDMGILMGACVDYRNLLVRAHVPDSVSGRLDGVEAIFAKYGIKLEPRRDYKNQVIPVMDDQKQATRDALEQRGLPVPPDLKEDK